MAKSKSKSNNRYKQLTLAQSLSAGGSVARSAAIGDRVDETADPNEANSSANNGNGRELAVSNASAIIRPLSHRHTAPAMTVQLTRMTSMSLTRIHPTSGCRLDRPAAVTHPPDSVERAEAVTLGVQVKTL